MRGAVPTGTLGVIAVVLKGIWKFTILKKPPVEVKIPLRTSLYFVAVTIKPTISREAAPSERQPWGALWASYQTPSNIFKIELSPFKEDQGRRCFCQAFPYQPRALSQNRPTKRRGSDLSPHKKAPEPKDAVLVPFSGSAK